MSRENRIKYLSEMVVGETQTTTVEALGLPPTKASVLWLYDSLTNAKEESLIHDYLDDDKKRKYFKLSLVDRKVNIPSLQFNDDDDYDDYDDYDVAAWLKSVNNIKINLTLTRIELLVSLRRRSDHLRESSDSKSDIKLETTASWWKNRNSSEFGRHEFFTKDDGHYWAAIIPDLKHYSRLFTVDSLLNTAAAVFAGVALMVGLGLASGGVVPALILGGIALVSAALHLYRIYHRSRSIAEFATELLKSLAKFLLIATATAGGLAVLPLIALGGFLSIVFSSAGLIGTTAIVATATCLLVELGKGISNTVKSLFNNQETTRADRFFGDTDNTGSLTNDGEYLPRESKSHCFEMRPTYGFALIES